MTPSYDHATLFLAPPAPPAAETDGRPGPAAGGRAGAARQLRDPFAVQPPRDRQDKP